MCVPSRANQRPSSGTGLNSGIKKLSIHRGFYTWTLQRGAAVSLLAGPGGNTLVEDDEVGTEESKAWKGKDPGLFVPKALLLISQACEPIVVFFLFILIGVLFLSLITKSPN